MGHEGHDEIEAHEEATVFVVFDFIVPSWLGLGVVTGSSNGGSHERGG